MTMWIYVDPDNRILAANQNSMAGNYGWHEAECILPEKLSNGLGVPLFKFVDGVVSARTQAELDADYVEPQAPAPEITETDEAIIELAALTAENSARLDEQDMALVELAALITGGEI